MKFSPATASARLVAVMFDGLLSFCAMGCTLMLWARKGLPQIFRSEADDPAAANELAPAFLAAMVVGMALPFFFAISVARRGATPGKQLMSLTVRNVTDGAFPDYPRALGRETLRFLQLAVIAVLSTMSNLVWALAFVVIFDLSRSRFSQTWYDRLTRTIIVAPVVEQPE